MNSERVREFNHVRSNSCRQPLQGCDALALITQGSALAARNPGLEVVNAFSVLVRVTQPALDYSSYVTTLIWVSPMNRPGSVGRDVVTNEFIQVQNQRNSAVDKFGGAAKSRPTGRITPQTSHE